jgi:hypothetical protein
MTPPDALLKELAGYKVSFILVGGVAATLHGSSRLTQDVDVVGPARICSRTPSW